MNAKELHGWADLLTASAVLSYLVSLGLGVHSAVGSMTFVCIALLVHRLAARKELR